MGLMNKIKDMFFEEADDEDIQINDNRNKIDKKEKVAKKIEFSKRRFKQSEEEQEEPIAIEIEKESLKEKAAVEEETLEIEEDEEEDAPVIFDDEDFIEDYVAVEETKEHVLYGGTYQKKDIEKNNKKFEPSPVISPVYGVLSKNYSKEDFEERKDLDHLFVSERKKKITFDSVRQKAYGDLKEEIESTMDIPLEKEDKSLLYDMEDERKEPVVDKVTLGDAEDYFSDLGLEYNVDYIDSAKKTRIEKNKELSNKVEEEVDNYKRDDEVEDKNLYDLIDMMYENKEE